MNKEDYRQIMILAGAYRKYGEDKSTALKAAWNAHKKIIAVLKLTIG